MKTLTRNEAPTAHGDRAAQQQLTAALLVLSDRGQTPPCRRSDPTRGYWTSDIREEREYAAAACRFCPALSECLAAAEEDRVQHHVWGGRDFTLSPRRQHQTETTAARTEGRM